MILVNPLIVLAGFTLGAVVTYLVVYLALSRASPLWDEDGEPDLTITTLAVPAPDAETSRPDVVDIWGRDSFPASDAPANW